MEKEKEFARANELLKHLDFDGCVELMEKLDSEFKGIHPLHELVCERMIELDEIKFITYCENY